MLIQLAFLRVNHSFCNLLIKAKAIGFAKVGGVHHSGIRSEE
ncbi:MAG: hypothetical protein QM652_06865 [Legionella sp.]